MNNKIYLVCLLLFCYCFSPLQALASDETEELKQVMEDIIEWKKSSIGTTSESNLFNNSFF